MMQSTLGRPMASGLKQLGFSLFELCVVLIVLSTLVFYGYRYYFDRVDDSKESLIKYQAATFARTIQNLYGEGKMRKLHKIALGESTIYLNEKGWPASAGVRTSVRSTNQSAAECEALWHGVFSNAPGTVIAGSVAERKDQSTKDFRISAINGRICRYELAKGENGQYFFDYDVSNGKVDVVSPKS